MKKSRFTAVLMSCIWTVLSGSGAVVNAEGAELPERFDLRAEGLVSSVKLQDPYVTDWAFAAMGAVETSQIAGNPQIDLSEWHLAYYTYCGAFGYRTTSDFLFNEGSYDIRQELGLLTSWIGPVEESELPYGDRTILGSELSMEDVRKQAKYHVTSAVFCSDMQEMKEAIYSGHALDARYSECVECFQPDNHAYYFDYDTAAFSEVYTHSVSIVGWDDTYPAANFSVNPNVDGAWLVKNSYGENWGEYGYFWLSYADPSLTDIVAIDAEPVQPDTQLYQHDDYGCSGSLSVDPEGDEEIYISNIFTAERDGWVTSAMLYNLNADTSYEITVCTDLTDMADPHSGIMSQATNVVLQQTGYQTIELSEPVPIKAGDQFSVIAHVAGEKGYLIPCEYATHTEWTNADGSEDYSDSVFTMDMLTQNFGENESFYSTDGVNWTDMFSLEESVIESDADSLTTIRSREGNICLKAVTKDAGAVTFSSYQETLPMGSQITLSTAEEADVYYAINGGAFTLYTEPIPFEEALTISAYADTGENFVYTQHYDVQKAAISSLLCAEDSICMYADLTEENTYHYYTESGVRSIGIMPISTGTVLCGEQELPSGVMTEMPVSGGICTLELTVTEKGLEPVTYQLIVEELGGMDIAYGDVDLDGDINAADAAEILVYAAEIGSGGQPELPDDEWLLRADFNHDRLVDASDAAEILIYATEKGAGN